MSFKLPCPACKKPVAIGATKCPHCLTIYSAEQMAERKGGAKAGFIAMGVIVLGILFTVYACSGEEKPTPAARESQSAPAPELTDEQSNVVAFTRGIRAQVVSCNADVDFALGQIDGMGTGRSAPIQAFEGLRNAEKSCRTAAEELTHFDPAQFNTPEAAAVGKDAIATCRKAVNGRMAAMGQGKAYLDSADSSMERAAQFRDTLRLAASDDAACKLGLKAIAAKFNVPDTALDFLD